MVVFKVARLINFGSPQEDAEKRPSRPPPVDSPLTLAKDLWAGTSYRTPVLPGGGQAC